MEPEILDLLKKNLAVSEANHKLLTSMRRNSRLGVFVRIVYWIVILGGIVYAYLQLEPYLNTVLKAYNDIQSGIGQIKQQGSKLNDLGAAIDRANSTPR